VSVEVAAMVFPRSTLPSIGCEDGQGQCGRRLSPMRASTRPSPSLAFEKASDFAFLRGDFSSKCVFLSN
jgi:hypothetical protein